MQALENAVGTDLLRMQIAIGPLRQSVCKFRDELACGIGYTPHSQVRTLAARTAIPVPAATPARAFFAPGSPCAKP